MGLWRGDAPNRELSQPNVTLTHGDVIGVARVVAADVPALSEADEAEAPSIAHVQRQEEELQRLHEIDMPPESYYDALDAWRRSTFPNACPHVLEHCAALEPFLDACIASGFSLGAAKLSLIHI